MNELVVLGTATLIPAALLAFRSDAGDKRGGDKDSGSKDTNGLGK
jgi:hypothetical protein